MPAYRRSYAGSYFFTLVTQGRRRLFATKSARDLLHDAMARTQEHRPWVTEAIALLPDHLHMVWRMPLGDVDYSGRIAALKKRFTRAYLSAGGREAEIPPGQRRHRLRGVWQRRFWEHTIRKMRDFKTHVEYIHANPVKHGLVDRPFDWEWSSFRRYVANGWYDADWCGRIDLPDAVEYVWDG